jgi:3'-phosphoadenosine 5'-phosphosulfate sulfotransferase (PAPS reductase)/FAD synthetase
MVVALPGALSQCLALGLKPFPRDQRRYRRSRGRRNSLNTIVYNVISMVYTWSMLEILKSATFTKWFTGLRDRQARARIDARIARLRQATTVTRNH